MDENLSHRSLSQGRNSLIRKEPGNLHNTVRGVFFCCQIMGILPLFGLMSNTSDKLRYTFCTPYTIYYVFSIFGQVLMLFTTLNHVGQKGIVLYHVTNSVFYILTLTSSLMMIHIARHWPVLMKIVEKIETELPAFRKNYNINTIVVMVLLILAGIVDEVLFIAYKVNQIYVCDPHNVAETYFRYNSPWIFDYVPVTMWMGIVMEIYHIQSTFIWYYNDWIVILVSLYLTEYFHVHNESLKKAIQQKHFSCATFRIEYMKIVHLVKLFSVQFGVFLILSLGGNIYWVSTKLFYAFNNTQTTVNQHIVCKYPQETKKYLFGWSIDIYHAYSFIYVITRALLVLQFAARIQSNAILPVYSLYDLPRSKFSIEVQRYISQIRNLKIALSGFDFFYVTRSMALSVLGTIITYELVLLQFDN